MRRALITMSLLLIAPFVSLIGAQQVRTLDGGARADARTLYRLEDEWAAALITRDSAYFRRTLHPDYVYSDERGVFTKQQVIADQLGTDTVTVAANDSMRAHVHGGAAVVVGLLVVSGRGAQGAFRHRYRFTDTWIKYNGRWTMIASQDYDIPR